MQDGATGRTLSAVGSNPPTRQDGGSASDLRDQLSCQWHGDLQNHDEPAVRELGAVVLASVGTQPLQARPVIWRSEDGKGQPVWHALAATDRFLIKVDLTVTQSGTLRTFASRLHVAEMRNVQAILEQAHISGFASGVPT
jgi:hypothetical protein